MTWVPKFLSSNPTMHDITYLKKRYETIREKTNKKINFRKIFINLEEYYRNLYLGQSNDQYKQYENEIVKYIRLSENNNNDYLLLEECNRILKVLFFLNSQMKTNKLKNFEDIKKYCILNKEKCNETTLCNKTQNTCIFSLEKASQEMNTPIKYPNERVKQPIDNKEPTETELLRRKDTSERIVVKPEWVTKKTELLGERDLSERLIGKHERDTKKIEPLGGRYLSERIIGKREPLWGRDTSEGNVDKHEWVTKKTELSTRKHLTELLTGEVRENVAPNSKKQIIENIQAVNSGTAEDKKIGKTYKNITDIPKRGSGPTQVFNEKTYCGKELPKDKCKMDNRCIWSDRACYKRIPTNVTVFSMNDSDNEMPSTRRKKIPKRPSAKLFMRRKKNPISTHNSSHETPAHLLPFAYPFVWRNQIQIPSANAPSLETTDSGSEEDSLINPSSPPPLPPPAESQLGWRDKLRRWADNVNNVVGPSPDEQKEDEEEFLKRYISENKFI
jgi:hypothetical protein